jgi:hypothetical protein
LDKWEKSIHCSQLVALSYNIGAQVTLSDSLSPEMITPSDIEKSDILIDVTDEVTFALDDKDVIGSKLYPDSPENSTVTEQTLIAQEALQQLKLIFKELEISLPSDLNYVFPLLGELEEEKACILDKKLDSILKDVGFYDLGAKLEKQHNDGGNKLAITIRQINENKITIDNREDYLFELDFYINTIRATIQRQTENLYVCYENFFISQKQTFLSLIKMYKHFINFCYRGISDGLDSKKLIEEKIK